MLLQVTVGLMLVIIIVVLLVLVVWFACICVLVFPGLRLVGYAGCVRLFDLLSVVVCCDKCLDVALVCVTLWRLCIWLGCVRGGLLLA